MTYTSSLPTDELTVSRPNPHKKNILINALARVPWWLLIILAFILYFVISIQANEFYGSAWNQIKRGIWVTVWVTLVAYPLSCLMGLIIAVLRRPSRSLLYNMLIFQPVSVYVELIRGIPTLVLIYYIVLALVPQMVTLCNQLGAELLAQEITRFGVADYLSDLKTRDIPNTYRAILALAVSYSAFLSEIFRAGLESVDKGQREAARSIGLTGWQTLRFIILPQAIRNVLPPLGNDFIAMLKESSLVSVVGVPDITRTGRDFAASTFTLFPAYNLIAMTYLVMTLSLSIFMKILEWLLGRSRRAENN